MVKKPKRKNAVENPDALFGRIVSILEQARGNVVRAVNTNMVLAYWLIGREIVQELQGGEERAEYGKRLVEDLSARLTQRYGKGFSPTTLQYFRKFYLAYAERCADIPRPLGVESSRALEYPKKPRPMGAESVEGRIRYPTGTESSGSEILHPTGRELGNSRKMPPLETELARFGKGYSAAASRTRKSEGKPSHSKWTRSVWSAVACRRSACGRLRPPCPDDPTLLTVQDRVHQP